MSGWNQQQGYGGSYGAPPPQQQYGGYNSSPPPQQGGYPGQQGYGAQGHHPPPQQGYPPQQQSYPPQQNYPPQQQSYPQQGYPPQQQSYQQGYPPQQGFAPQQQGYQSQPPQQYPRPQGPPPQGLDEYGYRNQSRGEAHAAPAGAQQFGHGAPQGYTFQYSNCSGARKALLIGINYKGQEGELRGCINDVQNLSAFLIDRYNYQPQDMVKLTDNSPNPVMQPTKANILRAMQWLVADAKPNDALFLHYSGHGGQTKDVSGDEHDGTDEVIYPVDFRTNGHIVDDDIHDIVVKPLQAGVRLTAIFDSCHSGSVMDLPYVYSTKGVLKEPNLAAEAGKGLLGAFSSYAAGDVNSAVKSLWSIAKSATRSDDAHKKTMETKTSPADVIMWSGSKDDQTSADATIASQATGAMSHAFIASLEKDSQQTYVQMLNNIRDILETKYSQKPQLSCSHPLDTNILFKM